MYIYIYIYVHIYVYVLYMYVYIYIYVYMYPMFAHEEEQHVCSVRSYRHGSESTRMVFSHGDLRLPGGDPTAKFSKYEK